ncbi:MAG TPA: hypothetical protein VFS67_25970 [Polyangiaceae bacterium]|nr:hypothetical protein [Polyangiaceae bacterium]
MNATKSRKHANTIKVSLLLSAGLCGVALRSDEASAQVTGFGSCDSDVPGYCFAEAQTVSGTGYGEAEYIVDSGRTYVRVTANYSGQYPTGVYATYAVVYCFASFEACSTSDVEGFATCEVDPVCAPENMQLHVEINE